MSASSETEAAVDYKLVIMRVGNKNGNFKNTVLDPVNELNTSITPMWGYNKEKFCGFRKFSLKQHNIFMNNTNDILILFKPSRNDSSGSLIGLAKVKNVRERPADELIPISITDEELGWTGGTSDNKWNTLFDIAEYWDLTMFKDIVFSDDRIDDYGTKLAQQTAHPISSTGTRSRLHAYLSQHVKYIVKNIKPIYVENIRE